MSTREEDENEDDFDHEKMKQWEDMFVDDGDGFEDDEQFVDDTVDPPVDIPAVSTQTNLSHPSEIPSASCPSPVDFHETTFPSRIRLKKTCPHRPHRRLPACRNRRRGR